MRSPSLATLVRQARACRLCESSLPLGPRPVFQIDAAAKILIAAQAPGRRVHLSGVPFDDPSGVRLRHWMGIDAAAFYDHHKVAILPMGFCYPGTGPNGDAPPRTECAPAWREALLSHLPRLELVLVIGRYAQAYHLPSGQRSVTETVRAWKTLWPAQLPLPHPSPRNQMWVQRNPWFARHVLPALRRRVRALI